jgi:hypothetical protein
MKKHFGHISTVCKFGMSMLKKLYIFRHFAKSKFILLPNLKFQKSLKFEAPYCARYSNEISLGKTKHLKKKIDRNQVQFNFKMIFLKVSIRYKFRVTKLENQTTIFM